jgi:DNA-binding winged helix-turn-helix (wHTH) protein
MNLNNAEMVQIASQIAGFERMTPARRRILKLLAEIHPHFCTYSRIVNQGQVSWGSVRVHIHHLRHDLDGTGLQVINTRNGGYGLFYDPVLV